MHACVLYVYVGGGGEAARGRDGGRCGERWSEFAAAEITVMSWGRLKLKKLIVALILLLLFFFF